MRLLLSTLLRAVLAGCATAAKMDTREQAIGQRTLAVPAGARNHVNSPGAGPAPARPTDGLPVAQLLVYSGIKHDEVVHPASRSGAQKNFAFRSSMQSDEIVAMFEGMLTRDGSQFKLVKLEPANFGGEKGFRFEYSIIRRVDNTVL